MNYLNKNVILLIFILGIWSQFCLILGHIVNNDVIIFCGLVAGLIMAIRCLDVYQNYK